MSYALKMPSGIVISPPCRGAARGTGWSCRAASSRGTGRCRRRAGCRRRRGSPRRSRRCCSCVPAPIAALAHDDAALDLRVRADRRRPPGRTDSRTVAPSATTAPAPITASGPTRAPALDARAARRRSTGGTTRAPGVDRRPTAPRTRTARRARRRRAVCDGALEDVEVRLQVALGGADVAPVAAVRRTRTASPAWASAREHAALDAEQAPARDHLEHLGLQHVHAGVDERRALPLARLLEEARRRCRRRAARTRP